MTTVVIELDGKRGAKYRIAISQLHLSRDGADGVTWSILKETGRPGTPFKWTEIATGREDTNDMSARVLAGWLTTPMPKRDLGRDLDSGALKS